MHVNLCCTRFKIVISNHEPWIVIGIMSRVEWIVARLIRMSCRWFLYLVSITVAAHSHSTWMTALSHAHSALCVAQLLFQCVWRGTPRKHIVTPTIRLCGVVLPFPFTLTVAGTKQPLTEWWRMAVSAAGRWLHVVELSHCSKSSPARAYTRLLSEKISNSSENNNNHMDLTQAKQLLLFLFY